MAASASLHVGGGVLQPTSDAALYCAARRLVRPTSQPLRIACLGTSITAGHRDRPETRFPSMLQRMLKQQYPRAGAQVLGYGYPGASAQYLHGCINRMVPLADVYVVELADNFLSSRAAYVEAGELVARIVLNLRQRAHPAGASRVGSAVILLAPFAQSCSKQLLRTRGFEHLPVDLKSVGRSIDECLDPNSTLPAVMEAFAAQHGVACVSVRHAVAPQLRRTQNTTHALRELLASFLHDDLVHPNSEGLRMIAQMLVQTLALAAARAPPPIVGAVSCDLPGAAGAAPSTRVESADGPGRVGARQPEGAMAWRPTYPTENASAPSGRVCAMGDGLRAHVLSARGWEYELEWSSQRQSKPGYIARSPGASLDVCFRPLRGTREAAARWFQFAFLRSYQGMGMVHGSCVAGCTCPSRTFNAHHASHVSEVVVSKLKDVSLRRTRAAVPQPCPCAIRLRVLNQTDSRGHKFKLVALFAGMRMYNPNFALCGHSRCLEKSKPLAPTPPRPHQ